MLRFINFFIKELNGSLGDIGVLFPIAIGLSKLGLNINIVLLLVGVAYILNAIIYRLPVSVQPMKGISSIVLASKLNPIIVPFSALLMSLCLFVLNKFKVFTNFRLSEFFIRGIQFGTGLLLLIAAIKLLNIKLLNNKFTTDLIMNFRIYEILIFSLILVIGLLTRWIIPSILALLIIGIVMSLKNGVNNNFELINLTELLQYIKLIHLNILDNIWGILVVSLMIILIQLPITIANAVYASSKTINDLYNTVVPESKIAYTCYTYNFFIGLLGGVPVCHGSGGITAHYVAGGKTMLTPLLIGLICISLSLINGIQQVIIYFPNSILAILLAFVGFKHMLFLFKLKKINQYALALGVSSIFLVISLNAPKIFEFIKG